MARSNGTKKTAPEKPRLRKPERTALLAVRDETLTDEARRTLRIPPRIFARLADAGMVRHLVRDNAWKITAKGTKTLATIGE